MSPVELPPVLRSLLSEPGAGAWPTDDGAGLVVGDSETSVVVRRDGAGYRVEEVQRGTVRRTALRTAEEEALVRYLALVLSRWSRDVEGLPTLPSAAAADLPEGTSLVRVGPRRYAVRWVENGVERCADDMIEYEAIDLARALTYPLDIVVAALHEPSGAPVFS